MNHLSSPDRDPLPAHGEREPSAGAAGDGRPAHVVLACIAALALTACQRETRYFEPPTKAITPPPVRLSQIQPGAIATNTQLAQKYDENAYALSEGQRLFRWYNCNGCHANGGGDKGPALMDNVWIYGSEPAQIYSTIVEGRPNGMPSFGGHIPENEVWELVAYVRSLSGLVSDTAAPNRSDTMQVKKPESNTEPQKPVMAAPSAASERP